MLSVAKPKRGGNGGGYYCRYYSEHSRGEGFWVGSGAELLGLPEHVEKDAFNNLLKGFSPDGVYALVQNAGSEKHQGFWDATYSVPKSLSALYAAAPELRQGIREAGEKSLRENLEELEPLIGASRQGKGGEKKVPAALTYGVFFHDTSRAEDPQLHWHCVLINVGVRPDGTTGALDTRALYAHKMYAGRLFREKLAAELSRQLGLEIEWEKNGFHINGVPRELCDAFSERRHEIVRYLAEHEQQGPVASREAAVKTRGAKKHSDPEQQNLRWAEVAAEHDFGPEKVESLLNRGKERLNEKTVLPPKTEKRVIENEQSQSKSHSRSDSPSTEKEQKSSRNRTEEHSRSEQRSKSEERQYPKAQSNSQRNSQSRKHSESKQRSHGRDRARTSASRRSDERSKRRAFKNFERELRAATDRIFPENQTRPRITKVAFALAYKHQVDRSLVSAAVDKLKLPIHRRFYRVEWFAPFPKAANSFRIPKIVIRDKKRRWAKITERKPILRAFGKTLSLVKQERMLFPGAPKKNPASKLSLSAFRFRVEKTREPVKQRDQEHFRSMGR